MAGPEQLKARDSFTEDNEVDY